MEDENINSQTRVALVLATILSLIILSVCMAVIKGV